MAEIESPKNLLAFAPWVNAIRFNGANKPTLLSKIVKELTRLANDGFEFDYTYKETKIGSQDGVSEIVVVADSCWVKINIPSSLEDGVDVSVKRKTEHEAV